MAPQVPAQPPPVGRPWVIAHRGASHVAPENTSSALRSALAAGADMVEVDVRRTADGELVLLHDQSLVRTSDVEVRFPSRAPWRVQDFTLEEIRDLDVGAWWSPTYVGEQVPTLAEALALLDRAGSRLLIEVKQPDVHRGIEQDIASLLRERGAGAGAQVAVQSFDVEAMHRFAWEVPDVPTGVLVSLPRASLPAIAGWASYLNPHRRLVDPGYVDAIHDAGMRCLPWTADDPRAIQRLLAAGVDGVITNRPEVARAVRAVELGGHRAH